jgi:hypothetical protein
MKIKSYQIREGMTLETDDGLWYARRDSNPHPKTCS